MPLLHLILAACTAEDSAVPADTATLPGGRCGHTRALDPDEDVVEANPTAAPFAWDPGTGVPRADGLAYEGGILGPFIALTRGQTRVVNSTNGLDHDSTIHWHGLRVSDAMDGAIRMEARVPPGGVCG